ncbi:MAG: exodeoxyribonuclease III [Spirochaetaceae bacterium]|nr:MAG: exodeoxyribonuclease III [Spirochaetaceae bacterium]
MMRIVSWNVNGVRAIAKKGFSQWLATEHPDVLCLQETKASPDQLTEELTAPSGYHAYFSSAVKKGYSGVAIYSRQKPLDVTSLGVTRFDDEGRVLVAEYPGFTLITAYFPNSQDGGKRLDYKLDFCRTIHDYCNVITGRDRPLIVCGDFNVAHKPIDLARPKENETSPGYLPEERAWMDQFIDSGYVDTFRMFNADGGHYTWWSYFTKGRERNIGWRIDYHCVNRPAAAMVRSAGILNTVMGSDHCPVDVVIDADPTR